MAIKGIDARATAGPTVSIVMGAILALTGSAGLARSRQQPQAAASPSPLSNVLAGRLAASCSTVKPVPATLPGTTAFVYGHTPAGRELRIFVVKPTDRGPHPAIELFFGGGFERGDVSGFLGQARTLAALGYVALLPDYSVSCRDHTTPLVAMADGQAAYSWLFRHVGAFGIDPKRVVLGGGSAGGGVALYAAIKAPPRRRPAALVLFNPSATIVPAAAAFRITPTQAAAVSALDLPLKGLPPTIVFHGKADQVIPDRSSLELCARMKAAGTPCTVHLYAGMNHGFFNSHALDPAIGTSPYADTLARTIAFLKARGITR